jgi:hypothetical protein
MADAQARADDLAIEFGEKAPLPLSGETLRAYRVRLARRYQPHCKEFGKINLAEIKDDAVLAGIENRIYADAKAASGRPIVGPGQLRSRIKQQNGHTFITWAGDPHAWMDQFSGRRQFVVRTKPKPHEP